MNYGTNINIKSVKKKNDFVTGELCSYKVTQLDDNIIYLKPKMFKKHIGQLLKENQKKQLEKLI